MRFGSRPSLRRIHFLVKQKKKHNTKPTFKTFAKLTWQIGVHLSLVTCLTPRTHGSAFFNSSGGFLCSWAVVSTVSPVSHFQRCFSAWKSDFEGEKHNLCFSVCCNPCRCRFFLLPLPTRTLGILQESFPRAFLIAASLSSCAQRFVACPV